jgi:hypothetical protein
MNHISFRMAIATGIIFSQPIFAQTIEDWELNNLYLRDRVGAIHELPLLDRSDFDKSGSYLIFV